MCVYAPTARAPPGVKASFFDDLQDVLDKVSAQDKLVVLGDFNARVGVRKSDDILWQDVLVGGHGLDERNLAGEELLEFSSINHLSIMNTWFQKKPFKFGTWMHPATKQFHQIDLVLVRSSEREMCIDAEVMRGANCWSDHKMVRG